MLKKSGRRTGLCPLPRPLRQEEVGTEQQTDGPVVLLGKMGMFLAFGNLYS